MADYRALLRPFETNFCASQHFSSQQQTTLHHFHPKYAQSQVKSTHESASVNDGVPTDVPDKKRKVDDDFSLGPDTSKPSAIFKPTGGRSFTLSLALPGSIIAKYVFDMKNGGTY